MTSRKTRKKRHHNYTFDVHVARTGEWLGAFTATACNQKEAVRIAREYYCGRRIKAILATREPAINPAVPDPALPTA